MTLHTIWSLAWQMARLIPDPRERYANHLRVSSGTGKGRCGCCPACGAFVYLGPPNSSGEAPCPSCGQLVRSLDALSS